MAGEAPHARYFIRCDPEADYSAVVRPRALPLFTEVETASGPAHVWNTFSPDQVDLDYSNAELLQEILDILSDYCAKGARFIRLDAIGFVSINREKLNVTAIRAALDDPTSLRHRVLEGIGRLLRARATEPALHPDAGQCVITGDPGLVLIERSTAGRRLLAAINVTASPREFVAAADEVWSDILSGETLAGPIVSMPAFAVRWLVEGPSVR